MSTIDPVLAASLAAFAPPQSEVHQSAEELKSHNDVLRAVIKSPGFQRCGHTAPHHDTLCYFETWIEEVPCVCYLDYTKASPGSRENGVPIEPDEPESADLCHVYVRDIDIASILSHDQIADVEEKFLCQRVDEPEEPDFDGMYPDDTSFG
jgi:hypothetical protein